MFTVAMSGVEHEVPIPLEEDNTFNVSALKLLLESRTGVSVVRQKLLFNTSKGTACILRDNQILSDAGVKHGSKLNVVVLPVNEASYSRQREIERNVQEESSFWQDEGISAMGPPQVRSTMRETHQPLGGSFAPEMSARDPTIEPPVLVTRELNDQNTLLNHASAALDRFDSCLEKHGDGGTNHLSGTTVNLEALLRRHFSALHALQMPVIELAEEYRTAKMSEAASAMVAATNPAEASMRARNLEESRRLNATQLAMNAKRVSSALSSFAVASTDLSLVLSRFYGGLLLENPSDALLDESSARANHSYRGTALSNHERPASPREAHSVPAEHLSPSDRLIAETIAESALVASKMISAQQSGSDVPTEADSSISSHDSKLEPQEVVSPVDPSHEDGHDG